MSKAVVDTLPNDVGDGHIQGHGNLDLLIANYLPLAHGSLTLDQTVAHQLHKNNLEVTTQSFLHPLYLRMNDVIL